MAAITIRPKPRLVLSEDIRCSGEDDRAILMAELFASADVLSQSVKLPIDFEINVPQTVGHNVMADEAVFEVPISITQFKNGLVEIKPGVMPGSVDVSRLTTGREGAPTDSILHLPLLGETLCIFHVDVDEGKVAIGGIVSLRDDGTLYEPHHMIYWNIPTFTAAHYASEI